MAKLNFKQSSVSRDPSEFMLIWSLRNKETRSDRFLLLNIYMEIMISQRSHHRGSHMVFSHRCSAEEGTSAPLLPETAEEVWNEPQRPQILLHLHCGEHPDWLHHRLVWKQHRWQPQSSAKGRANCLPHCWRWASLPPGHIHQAVYKESQGLQPPVSQSALSAALRKTSPQHPIPH